MMNKEKLKAIKNYLNALEHIWASYFFFYQAISNEDIRKRIPNVSFGRSSQVESILNWDGLSFVAWRHL